MNLPREGLVVNQPSSIYLWSTPRQPSIYKNRKVHFTFHFMYKITPEIPDRLGTLLKHPHFPCYVFKSHVIEGEPIAINLSQIQTQ